MRIIRGRITVIKNKKDYYKIRKQTILVAQNTHPDLLVVLDKIKAIVTEVDNKLCHAAIVAREFNKPLLMGIKNVTKEFKTGDKVMLDMDNRIINKIR